ncbi:Tetratricopeptide TPR_2 repeat protein [Rhodopirellula sp. SWK7]|uniref:Tetratricopeptide TPR_2 repeat protein n=1 Tax=Rhodopirellula sp. SWK7 TaxID=595460 RepID=UPI0002C01C15|nr:Tetratricopeptide TPR_2 repeat protein [Rhodopirellula sp. SWK7]EMI45843.1 Tetratricopeptide TPR_2 repeat protein [Rhodopirellula sp. SWK7]
MPDSDKPNSDAAESASGSSGLSLSVATAGTAVVATMTGFAYLFSLWASSGDISPEKTLKIASAQYVAGNAIVAGELADTIVLDEESETEQEWLPLHSFLLGAGQFEKAMLLDSPRARREELQLAIPPLLRAEQAGFPEGRSADGHRMLGLAFQQVGDYEAAAKHLQAAIDVDLTLRGELVPVLAVARARRPHENLNEAIVAIDEYLNGESLDAEHQIEAYLMKIDWLIRLRRFKEAESTIKLSYKIIAPAMQKHARWSLAAHDELSLKDAELVIKKYLSSVQRAHGERLIADIPAKANEQISEAERETLMKILKDLAVLQREAEPALASRSRLTAAQAFLLAGEPDLALAELTQLRQQRPFREDGLEGGLSEMELLANHGQGDESVQTAKYLVREMQQSRHLNFTQKKEAEFRSRITEILAVLRESGEYAAVVEIADSIPSLFGEAPALIEKAIAYRDWGDATLKAGRGRGDEVSRDAFATARARFRGAGDAFASAAEKQFDTIEYVPTLWQAIDSYQRGRHFSKSIPLLENFLRYEERLKQPAGLVAHGRALLAEGRPDEAMDSLQTCIIEFTRDPMRYEARLLAAQAAADSHNNEEAKRLLVENLSDGQLTPQSPVWRDSLFTLGELLYAESDLATLGALALPLDEKIEKLREIEPDLNEALRRLTEAVDRYWPLPRAQAAAYELARGQLLASRLPEAELESENLLDAAQRDLRQKANRYRQSALDRFTAMVRFMDMAERDDDLSEKQNAILRNSLLGQADTLKSMRRYAEAADAYRDMSLRYMNEPPALEALLGQSRMARILGRDREADMLISQAAVVLDRIGEQWDDRFDEMTRFSRDDWRNYLQWMTSRLDQASRLSGGNRR